MYRITIVFIVLFQVYYGYRYLMQYNSASTSPTYSDTPFPFQVGKHILMSLYISIAFFFVWIIDRRGKPLIQAHIFNYLLLLLATLLTVYFSVRVAQGYGFGDPALVKGGLAVLSGMAIASACKNEKDRDSLFRWMVVWPLFYHIAYEIIQVYLLYAIGRLPALGYAGIISRFGGGWDDPNGFGVYLVFPLLVCLINSIRGKRRLGSWFVVAAIVVMLFLTYSYSALVSMVLGLVLLSFMIRLYWWSLATLICGFTVYLYSEIFIQEIVEFTERKSASALSRVTQVEDSFDLIFSSPNSFLFGAGEDAFQTENVYLGLQLNYGFLTLFVFLCALILLLNRIRRGLRAKLSGPNSFASRYLISAYIFCFVFVVAGNFVPVFFTFPINIIFWASVYLLVSEYNGSVELNKEKALFLSGRRPFSATQKF